MTSGPAATDGIASSPAPLPRGIYRSDSLRRRSGAVSGRSLVPRSGLVDRVPEGTSLAVEPATVVDATVVATVQGRHPVMCGVAVGGGDSVDDEEEVLGPVGFLAVEFPAGRMTGEGFELVFDLTQRGIIRVLDLAFVAKAADGSVRKVTLGDVEHDSDIDPTMWDGASSGLLDQSDIDQVASSIEPGSLGGILVYENTWAVPIISAIDRNGDRIVGQGSIMADDLLLQLDATEPS